MEPSQETINARVSKINAQILGKTKQQSVNSVLARDTLLDAFQVLYDECNIEALKQNDKNIQGFVEKQKIAIQELKKLRVNVSDFEIKDVIGQGHFGEVHLVKEKQTSDVYAMKTIRKTDSTDAKRASFVEERNIMALNSSIWLTSLRYAFQDDSCLFYVMEYHPGGDLLGLLHRQGGSLPESAASFYIAEIVLALRDLHEMGYVHRDVKPDNVLLDRCGHLKLADFGSAAKLDKNGMVSEGVPVGTPDYIAPEVLQSMDNKSLKKGGYGVACDYWSVGVLAYELTAGSPPFAGKSTTLIYSKIMNHHSNLKFPPDIVLSQAYVSLVKGLICDQKHRLTHEQILKHPLFKNVDFGSLRDQVPPHVPKITAVDDTSNFSDIEIKKKEPNMHFYKKKTQFSGRNLPFIGFTFTPDENEDYLMSFKRSVKVKDELVQDLRQEVNSLHRKLMKTENLTEEKENLEKKLEERSRKLESVEHLREKLERDLAKNISECMVLKRTLELERKDRAEVEQKALDLIKTAKQKWEAAEKDRIEKMTLELEQQKEKIDELSGRNNILNEQLQHAFKLENKHKVTTENIERLSRRSVIGLESRLEKVTSETQSQLSDLRVKLTEETRLKTSLESQLISTRGNESALISKLQNTEANQCKLKKEIEDYQKTVADLKEQIESYKQKNKAIEEYKRQVEELNLKNESMKKYERELVDEKNRNEELKAKIQNLKIELNLTKAASERDSAALQQLNEKYQASLAEAKALQEKQTSALEKELREAVKQRDALEIRLEEATRKELSNRAKVQTLEELLARLESGVAKLENGSEREELLKEQVERLEQQLVEVHESSALQKQELTQLKTKFWRVEKDLENAEIDKRILQRELKDCEKRNRELSEEIEKIKQEMEASKKIYESALLELNNMNESLSDEIYKLKDVVKSLEGKFEGEREKCDAEKSFAEELKREINEKERNIASLMRQIDVVQNEKKEIARKLEDSQRETAVMQGKYEAVLKEQDSTKNELMNARRELNNTQLNLNALREACTILESQLTEYEAIHEALESKQASLNANTEKLISDLVMAKEEIREARKLANEEKSLRFAAESQVKRLTEDVECLEKESTAYKRKCGELKEFSAGLSDDLNCAEGKIGDLEVTLKSRERQIEELLAENRVLKEENSAQLTHLCNVKETNFKLNQHLNEYKESNEQLLQRLTELENVLSEKIRFYKERELKSDATIQQQTKLIDYLQSKNEELSSKKKSFAERIFSHSKKENQPPPSLPLNYKDLENQLSKERQANKNLREEMEQLKSAISAKCTASKAIEDNRKKAMELIVKSPASQGNDLSRQNSVQRMRHNIPHRFESKICTKSSKCAQCSVQMSLGRNVSFCKECGVVVHSHCAKMLPRTCGLPQAYAKHYTDSLTRNGTLKMQESTSSDGTEVSSDGDEVVMEGWMKMPSKTGKSWEKRYAKLTTSTIHIYEQSPENDNGILPVTSVDLKPADGGAKIVAEPSASEIEIPVATTDMRFLIKLEILPNTTCWPTRNFLFMMLSAHDKERWYKALESVLQTNETKQGDIIVQLDENLYVNCFVKLLQNLYILGTDQGLFSCHDKNLTRISGISQVYQISVVQTVNKVLMIADAERILICCDLNRLRDLAECASCSRPRLDFEVVHVNNLRGFHLLEVADFARHKKACAATSKQLAIFDYCEETSKFVPVRVLDTAEPTSCVLFAKYTVLVGANKFYEVDLRNFAAEEFLDASDVRLAQAIKCYKIGSFPLAILRVNDDPIEYLVCFNEFAFFVDEYGRNSRETDVKWTHLPRAFYFSNPYLYVVQFSAVEVLKITRDTCNLTKNSLESLLGVDSFRVEFDSPRFLGGYRRGIFVETRKEIKHFDAHALDNGDLSVSSRSSGTNDGNNADSESERFSFTSSVVNCLDGSASDVDGCFTDGSDDKYKRVKFQTDL